jgi:hypothetical protein
MRKKGRLGGLAGTLHWMMKRRKRNGFVLDNGRKKRTIQQGEKEMKIREKELDRAIDMVEAAIQNLDEIDERVQAALQELDDLLALLEEKK